MAQAIRYNEKEKEADFYNVLIMLNAGWSYTKMSDTLNRSRQYCCNVKMDLVESNLITQGEIDYARKSLRNKNIRTIDEIVNKSLIKTGTKLIDKDKINKIILEIKDAIERINERELKKKNNDDEEKVDIKALKKEAIKKLILANYSKTEICRETGYARTTVSRYVNELIEDGEIDSTDVKNGKEEEMDMVAKRNELIIALLEFNIPYNIIEAVFDVCTSTISLLNKSISKLSEEEIKIRDEKILALIEFDIPYKIISVSLDVSINYIIALKRKNEGRTYKRRKEPIQVKEIDTSLNNREIKIIKYLNAGYFYPYIRKKLSIEESELMKIVNDLKLRMYITQEIINNAFDNRRAYYKEMVKKYYNDGLSQSEIYRLLNPDNVEEISSTYVNRIICKLDDEGLINHDRISEIKDARKTSFASVDKMVLALLIKGYTVKEMCEQDETKVLTESRVRRSKKRLIEQGKITEKDILRYQRKRQKKQEKKALMELDKEIWYYVENYGLSSTEIANYIDTSYSFLTKRIRHILDKKKLNKEDFNKLKKKGREMSLGKKVIPYKEYVYSKEFSDIKSKFLKMYDEKDPTTEVNVEYFNAFKNYVSIDLPYDITDVDILSYIVLYTSVLCNEENITFVIEAYLSIGEENLATFTLNDYLSLTSSKNEKNAFRLEMMKMIKNNDGKKKKIL